MNVENEVLYGREITCPNCKKQVTKDSWEWDDSGEEICGECGCTFFYERDIEVTYSSKVIKLNKESE